ncbi:hypothetical protein [Mycoplasmopsis arginini]|uniref:hypothetical protein n=1 Tax=Mycoplasmopsis arginini TaxID=2094 RepID=UPI003D0829ED
MNKLNGKLFWITYTTLNIALLLIFSAIAFLDYSLLLGYLVGIVSFLLFLVMLKLSLRLIKNSIDSNSKKQYKTRMFIAILIFLLLMILNVAILGFFIWINSYYHSIYPSSNLAFFPFNTITITAPYLLLSVFSIIWAVIFAIKKRKEDNGQTIKN